MTISQYLGPTQKKYLVRSPGSVMYLVDIKQIKAEFLFKVVLHQELQPLIITQILMLCSALWVRLLGSDCWNHS